MTCFTLLAGRHYNRLGGRFKMTEADASGKIPVTAPNKTPTSSFTSRDRQKGHADDHDEVNVVASRWLSMSPSVIEIKIAVRTFLFRFRLNPPSKVRVLAPISLFGLCRPELSRPRRGL